MVLGFLLLLLLSAAAWHDIHSRRIPNVLVLTGTIAGLLSNAVLPQQMGGLGIFNSFAGLGIGFVLLLPPYLLRAMGAGDVKLMAMTGAFLGAKGVMDAFVYILLAGGLLALAMAWRQGKLTVLLGKVGKRRAGLLARDGFVELDSGETRSRTNPSRIVTNHLERAAKFGQLPYGVAIAAGTAVSIITVYG
jgi:prepilin peptidase CpaA